MPSRTENHFVTPKKSLIKVDFKTKWLADKLFFINTVGKFIIEFVVFIFSP